MSWEEVEAVLPEAKGVAFDGCHKIYILLDEPQMQFMRDCGYDENEVEGGSRLYTSEQLAAGGNPLSDTLEILHKWFDASCFLKFIYAVRTVESDPNDGFTALIRQGEFEDQEDDE